MAGGKARSPEDGRRQGTVVWAEAWSEARRGRRGKGTVALCKGWVVGGKARPLGAREGQTQGTAFGEFCGAKISETTLRRRDYVDVITLKLVLSGDLPSNRLSSQMNCSFGYVDKRLNASARFQTLPNASVSKRIQIFLNTSEHVPQPLKTSENLPKIRKLCEQKFENRYRHLCAVIDLIRINLFNK